MPKKLVREKLLTLRRQCEAGFCLELSRRIQARFLATDSFLHARCLALYSPVHNEVATEAVAREALAAGKSLLPAGVAHVSGDFRRGDAVLILDQRRQVLAHGLSAYDSADAARIVGLRSHAIEAVLGYRGREELVHRNDMAMVSPHG